MIGLGSTAAGSAALVGTGAFSEATVRNREVNIELASDQDGLLEFHGVAGPHRESNPYVEFGGNKVQFNFDGNGDWDGLNEDSEFHFNSLFRIVNNGQAEVDVWFDHEIPGVTFYRSNNPDRDIESEVDAIAHPPGTSRSYGISIDTEENDGESGTVDIRAKNGAP